MWPGAVSFDGHNINIITESSSPPGSHAGGSSAPQKPKDRQSLYKTELCREFSTSGWCYYGRRCSFAHGLQELRPVFRSKKWRTKRCRNWHTTGYCPYEHRCQFLHDQSPPRRMSDYNARAMPQGPRTSQPMYFHYHVEDPGRSNRHRGESGDAEEETSQSEFSDEEGGEAPRGPAATGGGVDPLTSRQAPMAAKGSDRSSVDRVNGRAAHADSSLSPPGTDGGMASRSDSSYAGEPAKPSVAGGGSPVEDTKKSRDNARMSDAMGDPQPAGSKGPLQSKHRGKERRHRRKRRRDKEPVIKPFHPLPAPPPRQMMSLYAQQFAAHIAAGQGLPPRDVMFPDLPLNPPPMAQDFSNLSAQQQQILSHQWEQCMSQLGQMSPADMELILAQAQMQNPMVQAAAAAPAPSPSPALPMLDLNNIFSTPSDLTLCAPGTPGLSSDLLYTLPSPTPPPSGAYDPSLTGGVELISFTPGPQSPGGALLHSIFPAQGTAGASTPRPGHHASGSAPLDGQGYVSGRAGDHSLDGGVVSSPNSVDGTTRPGGARVAGATTPSIVPGLPGMSPSGISLDTLTAHMAFLQATNAPMPAGLQLPGIGGASQSQVAAALDATTIVDTLLGGASTSQAASAAGEPGLAPPLCVPPTPSSSPPPMLFQSSIGSLSSFPMGLVAPTPPPGMMGNLQAAPLMPSLAGVAPPPPLSTTPGPPHSMSTVAAGLAAMAPPGTAPVPQQQHHDNVSEHS